MSYSSHGGEPAARARSARRTAPTIRRTATGGRPCRRRRRRAREADSGFGLTIRYVPMLAGGTKTSLGIVLDRLGGRRTRMSTSGWRASSVSAVGPASRSGTVQSSSVNASDRSPRAVARPTFEPGRLPASSSCGCTRSAGSAGRSAGLLALVDRRRPRTTRGGRASRLVHAPPQTRRVDHASRRGPRSADARTRSGIVAAVDADAPAAWARGRRTCRRRRRSPAAGRRSRRRSSRPAAAGRRVGSSTSTSTGRIGRRQPGISLPCLCTLRSTT